jgi:hypothetical protein
MKQIAKAILSVMKEVKGMEKNSKVGTGQNSYSGTKDQDVKEVFNEALERNGLCILPTGIEESTQIDRWEQIYNGTPQQKQSVFTKVKTSYMLLHESGEFIDLVGYGHGVDPQDKSAGKATTYALKNCLLYTFLTPVGKIDDADTTHSDDIPTPQTRDVNSDIVKGFINKINGFETLDQLGNAFKLLSPELQKNAEILEAAKNIKTKLSK